MTQPQPGAQRWWALAVVLALLLVGLVGFIVTHPKAGGGAGNGPVDAGPTLSDVVTVPRPAQGTHFGLYLMGQQLGYMFMQERLEGDRFVTVIEQKWSAVIDGTHTERYEKTTRVYDARPGGALLSLVVEQSGDSGEMTLEVQATPTGMRVLRKRPGQPNETRTIAAAKEVVEDADQVRLALRRKTDVIGTITEADLEQYPLVTTLAGQETRLLGGREVPVWRVETRTKKSKDPLVSYVDESGRLLELHFGPTMVAFAQDERSAKAALAADAGIRVVTEVRLPRGFGAASRRVPGKAQVVLRGLPAEGLVDDYRQKYRVRADGSIQVDVVARAPTRVARLPVEDPDRGANLKRTVAVDSGDAAVREQARKVVGDAKDAYEAAKRIVRWVDGAVADEDVMLVRASEVLRAKRGDCTEHALLAVAMLRAVGIPARVVGGLVEGKEAGPPAYKWHEWVEAFVGEWTQLDPTFGEAVASAAHLQLDSLGPGGSTPLMGALTVLEVR